jgi:broad specificity phosphatase PhoE
MRLVRVALGALVLAASASSVEAQVLVLVRHAERVDQSRDAELSEAGKTRARALARMLKDAGIEAIYSTDYIRTRETARPLAELLSKPVEIYDGEQLSGLVGELRTRASRALVVGHSDTTHELVGLLGGDPGAPIASSEYDRVYILGLAADGTVATTILRFSP